MRLTFTSSKGGVGKSTACAAIACALAGRGESVHILDLDPNETLARWARRAPYKGLTVQHCVQADFADAFDAAEKSGVKHIIVDLAGFLHAEIFRAFAKSDLVIIPAGASEPDLREAWKLSKTLKKLGDDLGREVPYRVLMTRMTTLKTRVGDYIYNEVASLGLPMIRRAMVERTAYKSIFIEGKAPTDTDPTAGAGAEVLDILAEIEAVTSARGAAKMRGAA